MINNILNKNRKSAMQSVADAEKEKEQNANNTQNMQVSNSNKFDAYLSDEYLSQIDDTKNTNEKKMKEEKKYTITIPTGQVLNVNKDAYEELKQWIALYNRCREFALENGIGIPPWEWVLSKGSRAMPELQQLAAQKKAEDISKSKENMGKNISEHPNPQIVKITIGDETLSMTLSCYDNYKTHDVKAQDYATQYGLQYTDEDRKLIYTGHSAEVFDKLRNLAYEKFPQLIPQTIDSYDKPQENKKGSSLLVPGIILAVGIVSALLLTKKSKRR